MPPRLLTLVLVLFCALPVLSQDPARLPNNTVEPIPVYPNTTDGLRSFLNDILSSIEFSHYERVSQLIKLTEIPNYEAWYKRMYPPDKAESWIQPYGDGLKQNEDSFLILLESFTKKKGIIATRKLVDTGSQNRGLEWAFLHSAKEPLDVYYAAWEEPGDAGPKLYPIGYFIFIDGSFRWDSLVRIVTPGAVSGQLTISEATPRPVTTGPRRLSTPNPMSPKVGKGAPDHGIVVLHLTVDEEGKTRDIAVQRSLSPEYDKAAVEAVTKWKFVPGTKNGKPASSVINVEVSFETYH